MGFRQRFFFRLIFAAAGAVSLLSAQSAPALQTLNPVLSEFEDGPPQPGARKVVPGETVFFRFGVSNFKVSADGKVRLTGHAAVTDPRGIAIAPPDESVVGTSLRDEDKDWKPKIRLQFQIPAIAPGGAYRIHFGVTDEQTHQAASGEAAFTVSGPELPASDALAVRQLAFYRTADDESPLKIPAYRAGDMIWVRFDVTGYKYGEQNAIDVSYDVAASNAAGRALFSQEGAAAEKSQAFYPQPWVPGSFSLTLRPDTAPGNYSVAITAHDGVGNQTASATARFRVE